MDSIKVDIFFHSGCKDSLSLDILSNSELKLIS